MCERLVADRDYYYGVRALSLKVPVARGQRMLSKRIHSLTSNAKWVLREAAPQHGRLFRLLADAHYTPEPPIADTPKTKQARGTSRSLG